jgi:L-asparaginase
MHLQIFTTGGTIDKLYFDAQSEYRVGEPQVAHILRRAGVAFEFSVEALMRKDSLDMTDDDRRHIVKSVDTCGSDRVLVTHGTDTMVETAQAMEAVRGKVIVLTGSLQPARFADSDAAFNIGCAVAAAQTLPAGAYVVMNGRVFAAGRCRKNRQSNRFEETVPQQAPR